MTNYEKNNKYRIVLVGDPHENNNLSSEADKLKKMDYLKFQYEICEKLKPDLIILMGDNASAENENTLKETLLRITKPYADYNIPFAFILGNHDLECNVNSLKNQYKIYRSLPCCIIPDEKDISPFGDYNITIKSKSNNKDIFNIWFMYSGNLAKPEYYGKYDFVKKEQIEWYEKKSENLRIINDGIVPSIVVQHIPVPEEIQLLKETNFINLLFDAVFGQNEQKGKYFKLNKKLCFGYMGEAPCVSCYNSGQFKSWKKMKDVVAAFFGHDHMNDFAGTIDGIILGQCKTAGFRPYGDGLKQAVRVVDINLDEPQNISTKMVYYRDFFGINCLSLEKNEIKYSDRISTKIDLLKNLLKISSPILLAITVKYIHKIKKSRDL